jgi:NAD(P)-dependent dehydrogenase (short-subunit alcohol dehydrogenase family)
MKSFAHKVAAITGAGSGMGRALAVELARRGCHLALSDIDDAKLEESAALARGSGVKVTTRIVNVAVKDEVYAWAEEVSRAHGKCNLIFNNAGVSYGATVAGSEYDNFEWIFGINFWGVVYGTKAFLPLLEAAGEGHIVNTSSVFGLIGFPGQSTYNATKFAVRGFTEALRTELEITRSPIGVTCVHPGGIKTNIARASRMHESLKDLGVGDLEGGRVDFEKAFRVTAEDAALAMLRGVERNKRRVLIGKDARALDMLQRILPSGYQGILAAVGRKTMRGR